MEHVGLENAVWPHLYWNMEMCESFIRSQDKRRLDRSASAHGGPEARDNSASAIFARAETKRRASEPFEREDELSAEDEDAEGGDGKSGRQSMKASFLAKVFSQVLGYGTDAELAQYVYDLWMWSRLGGAKNASGIPLRLALAGNSFSPEFWRTWHA
eukprot:1313093-Amphidinium_carterae.1